MIEAIVELDNIYYTMYYATVTQKLSSTRHVPAPVDYFKYICFDSNWCKDADVLAWWKSKKMQSLLKPSVATTSSGSSSSVESSNLLSLFSNVWEFHGKKNPKAGAVKSRPLENPLLELFQVKACETLSVWQRGDVWNLLGYNSLKLCKPRRVHAHDVLTMKQSDPIAPPGVAKWRDSVRDWMCHLFAYAVPNTAALDLLASHAPLLELGAGTI